MNSQKIILYIKNMFGDIINVEYNKDNDIINIYKDIKKIVRANTIEIIHLFYNSIELYNIEKSIIKDKDQIDLFICDPYKEKCVLTDYIDLNGKKCLRCIIDWYPELWDTKNHTALIILILKNNNNEFKVDDRSYYYKYNDYWFKNLEDAFIFYKKEYNKRCYNEKLNDNEINNMIHLWNINHKFTDYNSNNDRLLYSRYTL